VTSRAADWCEEAIRYAREIIEFARPFVAAA
jgi:hypothetical protein